MIRRRVTALEAELAELRAGLLRFTAGDSSFVTVGEDCRIDPGVTLIAYDGRPVVIEDQVRIYRGSEIVGPVHIGANTFVNRDAYIRPNTTIGERVNLGPFVRIVTDTHDIAGPERRAGTVRHDAVHIGDGAWIGAGAMVLGGVTVGEGAVVAAGSVVISDVPAHTVVAGTPARHVRDLAH